MCGKEAKRGRGNASGGQRKHNLWTFCPEVVVANLDCLDSQVAVQMLSVVAKWSQRGVSTVWGRVRDRVRRRFGSHTCIGQCRSRDSAKRLATSTGKLPWH